jgi:hypothetical protein
MRSKLLPSITFITILLLVSTLKISTIAEIDSQKENSSLPGPIEGLLASYSTKLNSSEIDRLRTKWEKAIELKQKEIESTNGAVLVYSPLEDWETSYLADYEFESPPEDYGYVDNSLNVFGQIDYNFAHFHTDGWNEDPNNPMGGEAFVAGSMSSLSSGNYYVFCKLGAHIGTTPPWRTYVIVFGSNDPYFSFESWDPIGFGPVNLIWPAWVYAGYTYNTYRYVAVCCFTPAPPLPEPFEYPDFFSCALIDSVESDNH